MQEELLDPHPSDRVSRSATVLAKTLAWEHIADHELRFRIMFTE
jgi:hypothetical protein